MRKVTRLLPFLILISSAFSAFADKKDAGKRWALVIGINDYRNRFIESLSTPRYNAKLVEDTLKNEGKFDVVIRMTDDVFPTSPKFPSAKNIKKIVNQIYENMQENDNFLLYFSGYTIKTAGNKTHLVTADSNVNNMEDSSLSLASISDICTKRNLSNSIFFIDSYKVITSISIDHLQYKTADDRNYSRNSPEIHISELPRSSFIFHSFSKKDFATNYKQSIYAPYSIFTYYLCDALRGQADFDNDNTVSITDLISFVKQRIISYSLWHPEQSIPTENSTGDFDFCFPAAFVPLLARPIFDPFQIDTSFYYQNFYLRFSNISLISFLISVTVFEVGLAVSICGLLQIGGTNFINAIKDLFISYGSIDSDLVESGIFTLSLGAFSTLLSFIPYLSSLYLNKTRNFEFSPVIGIENYYNAVEKEKNYYLKIGISMKTKKI